MLSLNKHREHQKRVMKIFGNSISRTLLGKDTELHFSNTIFIMLDTLLYGHLAFLISARLFSFCAKMESSQHFWIKLFGRL